MEGNLEIAFSSPPTTVLLRTTFTLAIQKYYVFIRAHNKCLTVNGTLLSFLVL